MRVARRELALALAIAWAMVVLRSLVYLVFEQSFFDSDQAIFGLMAKHLAEGRAFPLFCYGQTYMLAVDAWVAAPIFYVAGASVAGLHLSLVISNLIAVTLLVVALHRSCGIRPIATLVPATFFAFVGPLIGASLIEAAASIGPFVYVPLLWMLRRRPLWFGGVLALGFLHREFTAYVVPVLLVLELWDRSLFRPERLRAWTLSAASFVGIWQLVDYLKPYADMMGPGTRGQLVHGYGGSQIGNIAQRVKIIPAELPSRVAAMFSNHLPRLYGARAVTDQIANQGHDWLFWPLAAALILAAVRGLGILFRRRKEPGYRVESRATSPNPAFALYLLGVGLLAAIAYTLTRPAEGVLDRYLLLAIYIPIGLMALLFAVDRAVWSRAFVTGVVVLIAGGTAVDHWHQWRRYAAPPGQPDQMRVLTAGLEARGIHVAMANYWRAYKVTFLTDERVKVASSDVVRIDEYQALANAEGDRLVTIQQESCPGGEKVGVFFLCHAAP
jgi:hypothetical protein